MSSGSGVRSPATWVVALVALFITSVIAIGGLRASDWNASVFVGVGEQATETREYAEARLEQVVLRKALGHDGKFFFVQANDPWLLDPANNAELLDLPVYRSQRMLYPVVASGLGLLGPESIVWGLLLVNMLGMAVGTFGTARLARDLGGSTWWGLAFLGNLGLLFTLTIDTAGILAAAFAIWAVAFLYENRWPIAVGMLAASVLAREVMLICAAGAAMWLWTRDRRREAAWTLIIPSSALAVWEVYIRLRLGPDEPGIDVIGWPFVGLVRALPGWFDEPIALAVGLMVLVFATIYLSRWWASKSLLGWAFLGFIPLAAVMAERVWTEHFDFTRAVAPLMTATILLVFVESRRSTLKEEPNLTSSSV